MEIERDIIKAFKAWKEENGRKPILLKGAADWQNLGDGDVWPGML